MHSAQAADVATLPRRLYPVRPGKGRRAPCARHTWGPTHPALAASSASTQEMLPAGQGMMHTAMFDYHGGSNDELTVRSGQRVRVLQTYADGWCRCSAEDGSAGFVPLNYLRAC